MRQVTRVVVVLVLMAGAAGGGVAIGGATQEPEPPKVLVAKRFQPDPEGGTRGNRHPVRTGKVLALYSGESAEFATCAVKSWGAG